MNRAMPHALYRFYDCNDALLYIGLTLDPGSRWKAHQRDKTWWHDVTNIRIEHYPDRASVKEAERIAIQTEHPRHNSQHNGQRHPTPAFLYLPADVAHRLTPNRDLSTLVVRPTPPPFGQWLQDIVETGHGYDHLAIDLAAAPDFRPAMHPGEVELLLHMHGILARHQENFTEAREIHNYLRSRAGVETRTDVYDLRADREQIWTPRRIWIWHGDAAVVQLDRNAYVDTLQERGHLPAEFRTVATACLTEGRYQTRGKSTHPAATAAVDDRAVALQVPRSHLDLAVGALITAELDRDLDPMRRLSGALAVGSVR